MTCELIGLWTPNRKAKILLLRGFHGCFYDLSIAILDLFTRGGYFWRINPFNTTERIYVNFKFQMVGILVSGVLVLRVLVFGIPVLGIMDFGVPFLRVLVLGVSVPRSRSLFYTIPLRNQTHSTLFRQMLTIFRACKHKTLSSSLVVTKWNNTNCNISVLLYNIIPR